MNVVMQAYNSAWPFIFQNAAEEIRRILQGNLLQVFHIGGTAVPGLIAKPVIDMMPVAVNLEGVDGCRAAFEKIGYEVMVEYGIPGRCYSCKGGAERTHQVHIFQFYNTYDIIRHLAVRDYLRQSPKVCTAYGGLKSALARRYPNNIAAYCKGKDRFVKRMERDVLQWFWKPCPNKANDQWA